MNVILIGAEGSARNVLEQIIDAAENFNIDIIIDGIVLDVKVPGSFIQGIPVLGGKDIIPKLLRETDSKFLFCLYRPDIMAERGKLLVELNIPIERFANFTHPSVYISRSVKMGLGNIILSHSTIQSNVTIGNFNFINSNITIEHETKIGNSNFIAANCVIGAKVWLKQYNFIGLNTSIRENIILDKVFVGMHSLIINNYNDCLIMGIPAKLAEL